MSEALQTAWLEGFLAGLREYAWWKDGVQYVGSCGTTLEEAIVHAKCEHKVQPIAEAKGGDDHA